MEDVDYSRLSDIDLAAHVVADQILQERDHIVRHKAWHARNLRIHQYEGKIAFSNMDPAEVTWGDEGIDLSADIPTLRQDLQILRSNWNTYVPPVVQERAKELVRAYDRRLKRPADFQINGSFNRRR